MQKSSQVSQSLYFSGEGEIGVNEEEMYLEDLLAANGKYAKIFLAKKKSNTNNNYNIAVYSGGYYLCF